METDLRYKYMKYKHLYLELKAQIEQGGGGNGADSQSPKNGQRSSPKQAITVRKCDEIQSRDAKGRK